MTRTELAAVDGGDEADSYEMKVVMHRSKAAAAAYAIILRVFKFLAWVFLPVPARPKHAGDAQSLRSTAWLDGLRGVAALLVVFHHASLLCFPWDIHDAWIPGRANRFIQFYFVRLAIAGPPQVAVFFVVSGYAISHRCLKLVQQGRHREFISALASSASRRYFRLFLPVFAVTLVGALMTWLGCFEGAGLDGVANPTRSPARHESVFGQVADWAITLPAMADPFSKDPIRGASKYDVNLWTLPVEFDNSMMVFVAIAAFARLRGAVRLAVLVVLACCAEAGVYWSAFLFLSGLAICDLRLQFDSEETVLPLWSVSAKTYWRRWRERLPWLHRALGFAAFLCAIHLLCMPEWERGASESPGYRTLAYLVPASFHVQTLQFNVVNRPDCFWVPIGAALLVLTVDHSPWLQSIFTTATAQYLGKLSFSLYLVHGPLLWSLGRFLAVHVVQIIGSASDGQYALAMIVSAVLWWPAAVRIADLTERLVDAPSVALAKWVYDKAVAES